MEQHFQRVGGAQRHAEVAGEAVARAERHQTE
jgi:hypothetical protein